MSIIIIAEAGVNHNGDIKLAYKLAEQAKKAGADYVKFQTFLPEKLVSKFAGKADYQKQTTGDGDSQLEMLKKLALSQEEFRELKAYCKRIGIGFLSTPFDLESLEFLDGLGMDFWKIPSGEITNYPYLKKIAETKKEVVLSTGMCYLEEIMDAVQVLKENGSANITVLHCNTEYPTPMEDVNLLAMEEIRDILHCPVGYSDHTKGIEVPIAAAALGAVMIEKHFTLDKNMEGPDHKASLEPAELAEMVRCIRNIELARGHGRKMRSPSEEKNVAVARKSIVAAREIKAGEILTEENITVKRPGTGISPMQWNEVLGTKAIRDFGEDELIEI